MAGFLSRLKKPPIQNYRRRTGFARPPGMSIAGSHLFKPNSKTGCIYGTNKIGIHIAVIQKVSQLIMAIAPGDSLRLRAQLSNREDYPLQISRMRCPSV
jgi:hypothetical protein